MAEVDRYCVDCGLPMRSYGVLSRCSCKEKKVIGTDTHCIHCGIPMKSCVVPGDCGCRTIAEIKKAAAEAMRKEQSKANSRQIGGSHYKSDGTGEEHWDRVARLKLDYFQAAVTKYVERCWKKNGIQDLEKAQHFLEKYLELARAGLVGPGAGVTPSDQYSSMISSKGTTQGVDPALELAKHLEDNHDDLPE